MDLTQFVPVFGNFAFMIVAFVVALSVIVAIHEYGHYIVGRWCGIHAEVFSLGFGPVIYSRRDARGTLWQVAALPLGGYVKFLGDANAASVGSDDSVGADDARRTMAGAPLWARTLTVAAGPLFNFILAIAIFTGSLMYQGRVADPFTIGDIRPLPAQFQSELRAGDIVHSVADVAFADPDRQVSLLDLLPLQPRLTYQITRDGRRMAVDGPYPMPPLISALAPRSAADTAGLRIGDVITAVDGDAIFGFPQLQDKVINAQGAPLDLTVWRGGQIVHVTLSPRITDEPQPGGGFAQSYRIGIVGDVMFTPQTEALGLIAAGRLGVEGLWSTATTSLSALRHIIIGQISTCNLSGPVGIAETSGSMARQGTQSFIWFIGALSAAVGLINLFPIPVLDGGHLMFYAYEAVTRRKPSDRAVQVFMVIGLGLILTMMSFTILNDTIFCP
ncbi:RIP metalloprotease RseP [Yoonia vestfoldensis]|uniref:Zinc metalloprotease n=1 Tax=Yoonia vestfoldensis TaxID=245188 RepID=A0A1Y0EAY7_9RHOB|nr:RIP metalloprotease RseP [Yoonia vestfoldensis]ARU00723.1 regulator of sigma-E protease RseP [Yoonia vestfoldensis]